MSVPISLLTTITAVAGARCFKISIFTLATRLLATNQVSAVSRKTPHAKAAEMTFTRENASTSVTKISETKSLVTKLPAVARNAACSSGLSHS